MTKIKALFYCLLFIVCSCSSPRFATDGIFVDDVDEYFNPKQNINVWVYANFYPYIGIDRGLKMTSLYKDDLAVLKQIDFQTKGTKILFSARPDTEPYHLIAVQHLKNIHNLEGFERKEVDSAYYYQKDSKLGRLDIRQVYIPYGNKKGLSLIYYVSTEMHLRCPYCKLDYLAKVNASELQNQKKSSLDWKIFDCTEDNQKETHIPVDHKLLMKHKNTYLKIYADYGASQGIQYFKTFNRKFNGDLLLKLCPDRYIVEWSNNKKKILKIDTIVVR